MKNTIEEIQVSYSTKNQTKESINSSEDAHKILRSCWSINTIELQEEFKVLLLNRSNKVLGVYSCSKGGLSSTVVDVKLIFAVALKSAASSIILAHNHPSGSLKVSSADKDLTEKMKRAGGYLDIKVLDHLVLTKNSFLSFSDEGLM